RVPPPAEGAQKFVRALLAGFRGLRRRLHTPEETEGAADRQKQRRTHVKVVRFLRRSTEGVRASHTELDPRVLGHPEARIGPTGDVRTEPRLAPPEKHEQTGFHRHAELERTTYGDEGAHRRRRHDDLTDEILARR